MVLRASKVFGDGMGEIEEERMDCQVHRAVSHRCGSMDSNVLCHETCFTYSNAGSFPLEDALNISDGWAKQ